MSSYGMDHDEFTAETGIKDGDPVKLTLPNEKVTRAVASFDWVGAGFCLVNIAYDSDKPGFADGSKYVVKRKRYAHEITLHDETNGYHPFTDLKYDSSEGIVIEANGKKYTRDGYLRLEKIDELERARKRLNSLPDEEKELKEKIAMLEGELK